MGPSHAREGQAHLEISPSYLFLTWLIILGSIKYTDDSRNTVYVQRTPHNPTQRDTLSEEDEEYIYTHDALFAH